MKQERDSNEMKAAKDFRVFALYTKTYNTWYLCKNEEQRCNVTIKKGKFRALVRIIQFDHSNGKFKYQACREYEVGEEDCFCSE